MYGKAQDTINLNNCLQWATDEHALHENYEFYSSISDLEEKNISKNWLPSITLNATYKYLSEATEIDIGSSLPIPIEMPEVSQHQYGATIEIQQTIYDGGITKAQKNLTKIKTQAQQKQLDISLQTVKTQVSAVYINTMLVQKQMEALSIYLETLHEQQNRINTAVKNGVSLQSNALLIEAEIIKLQQEIEAFHLKKEALVKTLEKLTEKKIDSLQPLDNSLPNELNAHEISRNELALFSIQQDKLEASKSLLNATRMPKAFAFGTLGYGYPGLDMFDETVHPYYVLGAGIKWDIVDWKETRNRKAILEFQKSIVELSKTQFTDAIDIQIESLKADIEALSGQIVSDEKLIALRKQITNTLKVQLDNGIITSSDFISELNNEKNAVLKKELHNLQRQQKIVEYLLTIGEL